MNFRTTLEFHLRLLNLSIKYLAIFTKSSRVAIRNILLKGTLNAIRTMTLCLQAHKSCCDAIFTYARMIKRKKMPLFNRQTKDWANDLISNEHILPFGYHTFYLFLFHIINVSFIWNHCTVNKLKYLLNWGER